MSDSTAPTPYIVQVWIAPAVPLEESLVIPGTPPITMRNIEVNFPPQYQGTATLLETDGAESDMWQDPVPDMSRLGKLIIRLSFCLLSSFSIVAARIIPKDLKEGDKTDEIQFAGPPPGISLMEYKVGFRRQTEFDPQFLQGDLRPEVEGAIAWFLAGLSMPNSIYQVLSHWIGLEMLAPTVEGPWQCSRCREDMNFCPHCGERTEEPKATRSIREFLRSELGVPRKEFEALSELRNAISHGRLPLDQGGLQEAANKAFRIQELLLLGIKRTLHRSADKPPLIESKGIVVSGAPAIAYSQVTVRPDFYDSFHG